MSSTINFVSKTQFCLFLNIPGIVIISSLLTIVIAYRYFSFLHLVDGKSRYMQKDRFCFNHHFLAHLGAIGSNIGWSNPCFSFFMTQAKAFNISTLSNPARELLSERKKRKVCFLLLILTSHSRFHYAIIRRAISAPYQLRRYKQSCRCQILPLFKGNIALHAKHSKGEKLFLHYREDTILL